MSKRQQNNKKALKIRLAVPKQSDFRLYLPLKSAELKVKVAGLKKEKAPIPLRELGLDGSHGLCGDQEK
ncbi:hypothetical protein ACPV5O_11260 [Vibrio maritimus]|uniref:hypothetical protein n=1 Tax=Vibrio maritimus TaxID=990268 RepID=UPI00406945C3